MDSGHTWSSERRPSFFVSRHARKNKGYDSVGVKPPFEGFLTLRELSFGALAILWFGSLAVPIRNASIIAVPVTDSRALR